MLTSGFTNTPLTRLLLFSLVASSILVSLRGSKHLFCIRVDPHLWRYAQFWRALVWQAAWTNAGEVLWGCMLLYQLRVVERLWGGRKFASFLIPTLLLTSLLPPALLALLLRPLSLNTLNYLPAGPTPLLFALLAQYHAAIPHCYKYRIAPTSPPSSSSSGAGAGASGGGEWILSDKSSTYLLAAQLALSQVPGSLIGAVVGWAVGVAWRGDLLPWGISRWRVPRWVVREKREGERFEGLRRRLEGENAGAAAAASASGTDAGAATAGGGQGAGATRAGRRTLGAQILDQFRGAF